MARPAKQTVDYFPHVCNHKKTLYIIEQRYGNDGYAFWFKLLELLGSTDGHYLDTNDIAAWEYLIAKVSLDEKMCVEILDLLAKLGAIDHDLWREKVVWSQNFVDGISEVYKNRRVELPTKPEFLQTETPTRGSFYRQKPCSEGVSTDRNPQSKVKESRVEESKEKHDVGQDPTQPPYDSIIGYLNEKAGKNFKAKSKTTRRHIKARWAEDFREPDFRRVIDNQVVAWMGDPKMQEYLRPQTLFGSKFEGYLNSKPRSRAPNRNRKTQAPNTRAPVNYDDLVCNLD